MKTPFLILLLAVLCQPIFAKQPNVLLIMADDLNNDMGCYGHALAQTPNLDRLATQGVNFNRAYNQFPLCGPSRVSMMTGLYPDQNGMVTLRGDFREERPDIVTLSQYFMNNGYHTVRVGKIYHSDNPNGIGKSVHDDAASWEQGYSPRGIEVDFEDIYALGSHGWKRQGSKGTGATLSWLDADGQTADGQDRTDPLLHTDGMVATQAVELISDFADEQPFFLAVGFYNPHTPYIAPKQFFDLYDPAEIEIPQIPDGYFESLPKLAVKTLTKKKKQNGLDPKLARQSIHAYLAVISYMDSQVGRVLAALDDPNGDGDASDSIRDNTIVIFVSDHGYHMGEHDHYQKMTLFENSARQPLIISAPGLTQDETTEALVELVDLYPTLAELAGLQAPGDVSGVSLAPILKDVTAAPRESALTQHHNAYTIRTPQWRYTRWGQGGAEEIELYDITIDPEEMHNLAHSDPNSYVETIAELDTQLNTRIAQAQP